MIDVVLLAVAGIILASAVWVHLNSERADHEHRHHQLMRELHRHD